MKKTLIVALSLVIVAILVGFIVVRNGSNEKLEGVVNTGVNNTLNTVTNTSTVLNLSGQGLTKVPEYVFSRTDLVELNLSNNLLIDALPSQIGNLKKLKVLNLSNNKFIGVPAEVGQLKNLEVLNLSNNQLTGLPFEIGNLLNLKLLDVSGNQYSESDFLTIQKNLPPTTIIKIK
ncbi:MAG: leucine-rich repeat domain-containing protein [Candidatus Paceibacterota bacterium]